MLLKFIYFSSPNVLHYSWKVRCTFDECLSSFRKRSRETLADVASHPYPFYKHLWSPLRTFVVPTRNVHGPHYERSLTCCTVYRKVHHTPSTCVLDRTTNDRSHTLNNRLTLNFTRTFITYFRNFRQMTKSVDPYLLHSLPINTPYPRPLSIISSPYTYSITLLN
jgi:hypothetical protein